MRRILTIAVLILGCTGGLPAQPQLSITDAGSGLRLLVINKNFPLLKVLLPGQVIAERGIEIEFPEHVTGLNEQTHAVEHLYFVSYGDNNKRTLPAWRVEGHSLVYETTLNAGVKVIARAELDPDGVRYSYQLTNLSTVAYTNLQAVTCVKLYSAFADTLLARTYVHHPGGFELLASETPGRLTMPLNQWLPCRYLVSYEWPVPAKLVDKDESGITRYNNSRKVDKPFIAAVSQDRKWVAATYTAQTGNLWTNPGRTCHHADPSINLKPGETRSLSLGTFIVKGSLDNVLQKVDKQLAGQQPR